MQPCAQCRKCFAVCCIKMKKKRDKVTDALRLANYQSRGGATNETRQEAHCGLTLMLRFGFCVSFGVSFGFNITEHPLYTPPLPAKQLQ